MAAQRNTGLGRPRTVLPPIACLLLCAAFAGSAVRAQERVIENHPNGTPHRVYFVDAEGRKEGTLEQFSRDGRLELRANYGANQLHGKFESFFPTGHRKVVTSYNKGRKHGLWREFAEDQRKVVFKTYRYDVLHGPYQSFHDNGKKKLVTAHRNGLLHGRYQQFSADGSWHRSATYKAGKLHGKVTIKRGRKIISRQRWRDGEITDLDGIQPFPRSTAALRDQIADILRAPKAAAKPKRTRKGEAVTKPDPKAPVRAAALRRLQAYRCLCGLPYESMELVPRWNDLCDAAAEVCHANGKLSHHPPRPRGFDVARYVLGCQGASKSNLSGGGGMVASVDSYMNDSDPSNIDRIGHRRWCLNPSMKFTGFGESGGYSAMWSMDRSGSTPKGLATVFYPPPGKVPVDFFRPRHAWSIAVLRGPAPRKKGLEITIHALDEYFQTVADALELDHLDVAEGGYGAGVCMVFRPVRLQVEPGARYLVRVSLDEGKTMAYRYVVEFCAAVGR